MNNIIKIHRNRVLRGMAALILVLISDEILRNFSPTYSTSIESIISLVFILIVLSIDGAIIMSNENYLISISFNSDKKFLEIHYYNGLDKEQNTRLYLSEINNIKHKNSIFWNHSTLIIDEHNRRLTKYNIFEKALINESNEIYLSIKSELISFKSSS